VGRSFASGVRTSAIFWAYGVMPAEAWHELRRHRNERSPASAVG
jgi:hypothetical protein